MVWLNLLLKLYIYIYMYVCMYYNNNNNNNNIVLYILRDVFIFCIIILLQTLFDFIWLEFFDVSITSET